MARAESKMVLGFLPIEVKHHAAILSLVGPATPAVKILDPFAGEGEFLEAAAKAWNVTPYANELDGERAAKCIERFGPTQAVRCDVERLLASNEAFGIVWANPPYDHDALAKNNKRIEFAYLRHAWKWAQEKAIVFWVVYNQHITEDAASFLAKHSRQVDVWALPGKHLGEYNQVVVVAIKGSPAEPERLYEQIMAGKAAPRPLTVQTEPIYHPPTPESDQRFVFAPDAVDAEQGLRLVQAQGAWRTNGIQSLLEVPLPPAQIEPIVPPRPGHLALVLAAGVADGAVIQTESYGRVAIRGKTQQVEEVARVEVEISPNDPDQKITRTTKRLKPTTTLTLLGADGQLVEMDGDEALLSFIIDNKKALAAYLNGKFRPMYQFDFNDMRHWLDRVRLKGKYPLYTAQKHVIGAVTRGFQGRDGILLIGQMGVGKTALGGSAAVAMTSGVVSAMQESIPANQVVLIVAPPHLIDKWERELCSLSTSVYVERIDSRGDLKAFEVLKQFMDRAANMGSGIAKIGLIKRDTTKLGTTREPAVTWKIHYQARWRHADPVPDGFTKQERIIRTRVPTCPHCGAAITQESKDGRKPASETWLRAGKRLCEECYSPLWQEARGDSSRPKPGEKYPHGNPRYRLDLYLKRMYPNRVHLLVWDEAHEAQHSDSGNGEAFSRMAGLARKVLAMTGTPFNGRASSLFNLEYALNPRVRARFAWGGAERLARKIRGGSLKREIISGDRRQRGRAESGWVAAMGVREQIIEERPSYDRDTGAYTGTNTYERPYEEAPGISPLLVAELLDHAIYFSLQDLGKSLPTYEEIALPVPMDADTSSQYLQTRETLKKYLIDRRWQGDSSFRGAYLQWSMNWPDSAWRPMDVIHNQKHPITGETLTHTVAQLSSYGENRIYGKEQQLLNVIRDELTVNRPVVIFVRQTDTRDIQPRLLRLIQDNVPLAKPFVLKNTVAADKRERVIETEVHKGTNVILTNPELVKTGLDLVFAPTLIFFEITFNLSTMMQAAGRSLRLNQTHAHCKTYYLYYEDTMEETAVHLMSRKQRAAKILNGDVGLTGLDALTESEAGLEEALMNAIGKEETLVDPGQLFKTTTTQSDIDTEDAAYWNVDNVDIPPMLELAAVEPVSIVENSATEPAADPTRDGTDTLSLLTANFKATKPAFNLPLLTPAQPPKAANSRPTSRRRQKPNILQAPDTSPNWAALHTESTPTSAARRVQPGLQMPLF